MERQLATVQTITSLEEIPGADRIESAKILGWNVVVPKNKYQPGEKVVYLEVDSFLPERETLFADFQKYGQKTVTKNHQEMKGHVLKTVKMRGVYSQGAIISLSDASIISTVSDGTNVSDLLNVFKYEEPIPSDANIIGSFDSRLSPKSFSPRVQSLSNHWQELVSRKWLPTVKVDGISTTLVNDAGTIKLYSRNWEIKAADSGQLVVARFSGLLDFLRANPGMAVQAEYAGPGISQNRLKLDSKQLFVFSVFKNGNKVPMNKLPEFIQSQFVPVLDSSWEPSGTLEEMVARVSTLKGNVTPGHMDEGVVYHLVDHYAVPSWLSRAKTFKIISNNYLVKNGE